MRFAHIAMGHPHTYSFNRHLARICADELEKTGGQTSASDLAAMKFDPMEGLHHYPDFAAAQECNVQREQRLASERGTTPAVVRRAGRAQGVVRSRFRLRPHVHEQNAA
jgi:NAD(P)H dehydrogenase (quinone)